MVFSGHRSREGIRAYSDPSYDQRLASTALLIPFASQEQDLNEFELDYVNDSQQEYFHNSTIEDSYDSTIEDFHDSTIEALQDLKDSVGAPCLQDSNFKEQNSQDSTQKENDDLEKKGITLQKKKRAAPYIDDSNSKVFKPFKIPMDDPEKIKLYKYHPRMPLRKATNNIILQLPKTDKPINITLNLSINN
ncbi:zinc finger mym-type protein 2-like: PROVISIONAL [Gigaspora margarita]|uniref:Zinc finger mym-type protein 2-like: PROVISIONAL n=1 Tax=Gigaspora margarita TaxID=4874 RepID=A0A8H4EV69_GIGMA|nr:zinc finger mym-type protein 2-like: PROVISIONAL [Gigaspora margarita]